MCISPSELTVRIDLSQMARLLIALAFALALAGPAQASRETIATRPGVTVKVDLQVPDGAVALVLLFEGGGGRIRSSAKGFAQLAQAVFPRKGIASALLDAPSDQRNFMGGMHPKFRMSAEHVADIDAVVAALQAQTGLPVWILGVSLGSRSVARYAVQRSDRIAGVVLLSSSTNNPRGKPIDAFSLHNVTVPLLAVAHRDDSCRGTPPEGAQRIVSAATASPDATARFFTGGRNRGRQACGIETHHTFFGIEDQVVSAIARYIAQHTP